MQWFFNQFLYGTVDIDYSVARVQNLRPIPEAGFFDRNGAPELAGKSEQVADSWDAKIVVYRRGNAFIPVQIRVEFEDGTTQALQWGGHEPAKTFWLHGIKSKVRSVVIDPDNLLPLDYNRINNYYTLKPNKRPALKYALKLTFWVQNFFEFLALFV